MPKISQLHAEHDEELVAALAADDLAGVQRALAAGQVSECAECATLHDDLLAIARATAVLPPAARPRDFRLSPEQAAELRPAGWRRFVAALASPRLNLTRPLGVGLTTIGLAGLLFAALPSLPMASGGASAEALSTVGDSVGVTGQGGAAAPAAPTEIDASGSEASPAAAPFASGFAAASPAPSPAPPEDRSTAQGSITDQSAAPAAVEPGGNAEALRVRDEQAVSSPPLLLIGSLILLLSGLALLFGRAVARRIAAG